MPEENKPQSDLTEPHHADSNRTLVCTVGGAVVGNMFLPGLGAIVGAVAGGLFGYHSE